MEQKGTCYSEEYIKESCLSEFSRFLNKETILVNDPIFLREAVQEYVTHSEKKPNNHKKIGNFSFYALYVTANVI